MKKILWLLLLPVLAGCGSGGIIPYPVYDYQLNLAVYTQLCTDVKDASTGAGDAVIAYACGPGKTSQEWHVLPVTAQGSYQIINVNSNLCMSVFDAFDTAPGQKVIQEQCVTDGSKPNQIWSMVKAPNQPGYNIVSAASQQCLDLPYGAIASEFQLQQFTCTPGDPAQGWTLTYVGP